MRIDVEILPKQEAARNPIADSERVCEPKGRMTWGDALTEPKRFFTTIAGPDNVVTIKWVMCQVCCFSAFLLFLVSAYFFVNTFWTPFHAIATR